MEDQAKFPTVEGIPANIVADKRISAEMIVNAAHAVGATIAWKMAHHGSFYASVVLREIEVRVEPWSRDVVIDTPDGSQSNHYDNVKALTAAIRGRVSREIAKEKMEKEQRYAYQRRQTARKLCVDGALEDLTAVFGETVVEACVSVDCGWNDETPTVRITVSAGKISGERLSVAEAVRFIQTMISAGYDLVKLNEVD